MSAAVDKLRLARLLHEISLYLQFEGDDGFRAAAYDRAGRALSTTTEDLAVLLATGRLSELRGIGPVMERHVAEFAATGRLAYHDELAARLPPRILELLRVPGLGPKRIHLLWQSQGIGDLEALSVAAQEGKLKKIRGIGKRGELQILAALEQLRGGHGIRMALRPATELAEQLRAQVESNLGVKQTAITGEVRRFCETVGRVELVASAEEPPFVLDDLERHPLVAKVLDRGPTDVRVQLHEADLEASLHVGPPKAFALGLHHHTGSVIYSASVQRHAATLGLTLQPWRLTKKTRELRVASEAQLFELLELPFIPPELREHPVELLGTEGGWLRDEEVQGVVHCHSVWSDGKATIEQMALAAKVRGFTYLTVTDHSQSAAYAGGLTLDELEQQWEEIDALNERLDGIRLFKGIEADILEDGSLDCPDRVLERLDVVIGSIHNRHKQDVDAMTARVLRAFDNPYLQIWGHPTGRLLQRRDPVPLRMDEVLDKAAEKGIILEVNGSPYRLDLSAEHVQRALARGLRLVVSADAHSLRELDYVPYAAATARKGGARARDVLNTLPATWFLRALQQRRASLHAHDPAHSP